MLSNDTVFLLGSTIQIFFPLYSLFFIFIPWTSLAVFCYLFPTLLSRREHASNLSQHI